MDAKPTELLAYFEGKKQNVVPLFQRAYSWVRKDWDAFWHDVVECLETDDLGARHFLGAVVSLPVPSVPIGVSKHLIIDGQQRLTTTALLLAAVRDVAADRPSGEPLADEINDLLVNRHQTGPDRAKLMPTEPDRAAFMRILRGEPIDGLGEGERPRIARGYAHFRDLVSRLADDGTKDPPDAPEELPAAMSDPEAAAAAAE